MNEDKIIWVDGNEGYYKDSGGNVWCIRLTPYKDIPVVKIDWSDDNKKLTDELEAVSERKK